MKCNEDTNKEYIKRRISKGKPDALLQIIITTLSFTSEFK